MGAVSAVLLLTHFSVSYLWCLCRPLFLHPTFVSCLLLCVVFPCVAVLLSVSLPPRVTGRVSFLSLEGVGLLLGFIITVFNFLLAPLLLPSVSAGCLPLPACPPSPSLPGPTFLDSSPTSGA